MSRLLLVEDDNSLGATLCERLQKEGHEVSWVQTLKEARIRFSSVDYELVILDVGLPDGSGFDLAREMKSHKDVPLVFMTAMNSAENRLEGYELGAEEFVPKPFHLRELLLRVSHVLANHVKSARLPIGSVTLDLSRMSIVHESGAEEFIPSRDFQVLRLLIESSPKPVSRDEILNRVWGEDQYPSHRTVDNSIVRLRQLLADKDAEWIRSVRGIGYQWAPKEERP